MQDITAMRSHLPGFCRQAWMLHRGREQPISWRSRKGGKRDWLVSVFISRLLSWCGLVIWASLSSPSICVQILILQGKGIYPRVLGWKASLALPGLSPLLLGTIILPWKSVLSIKCLEDFESADSTPRAPCSPHLPDQSLLLDLLLSDTRLWPSRGQEILCSSIRVHAHWSEHIRQMRFGWWTMKWSWSTTSFIWTLDFY